MSQHLPLYSFSALCQALQTTPSAYYAWKRRQACPVYQAKQQSRDQARQHIKMLFEQNKGRSGRIRLAKASQTTPWPMSEYRVRIAMQTQGLR